MRWQAAILWSPKRNANGARNPFYELMREVAPGDLIISFADTRIPAIGVARSYRWESPKPQEFGTAGANWENVGWKVSVDFTVLKNRIRPKDHIDVLRPLLPQRYAPLQADGNGLQGVYLTELPAALAEVLLGLIGAEAQPLQVIAAKVTVMPRPVRTPMPPIMLAALLPEAIYASAKRGFHIQTTPLNATFAKMAEQVDAFSRAKGSWLRPASIFGWRYHVFASLPPMRRTLGEDSTLHILTTTGSRTSLRVLELWSVVALNLFDRSRQSKSSARISLSVLPLKWWIDSPSTPNSASTTSSSI